MIVYFKISQIKTYQFSPISLSTLNNHTFLSKRYTIFLQYVHFEIDKDDKSIKIVEKKEPDN